MACTFYKLIKKAQQETKYYGFEKIDRERERELVHRLQRDTVSTIAAKSVVDEKNPNFSKNPSRISSAYSVCTTCNSDCFHRIMCPRYDETVFDEGLSTIGRSETISRASSVKDMNRVISRLQTPTLSYGMKRRVAHDGDDESIEPRPPTRELTDKEQRSLVSLNRPTFSRRAKQPWNCTYCADHPDNAFNCRCRHKLIEKYGPEGYRTYVRNIVNRVTKPTELLEIRREPEEVRLKRNRRRYNKSLPLISGLDRSKTVDEVVDRLHKTRCHNAHHDDFCSRAVSAAQLRSRARSAMSNGGGGPIVYIYRNDQGQEVHETIQEEDEYEYADEDEVNDEFDRPEHLPNETKVKTTRRESENAYFPTARRFSEALQSTKTRPSRGSIASLYSDSDSDPS